LKCPQLAGFDLPGDSFVFDAEAESTTLRMSLRFYVA
jgi:hypothetical protein